MERLLFGLHIPRCAGTSLLTGATRQLAPEQMYQAISLAKNWWRSQFELEWIFFKDQLDLIWGHYVQEEMIRYFNKSVILFTGLREPRERMRSQVHYVNRIQSFQGLPPVQLDRYLSENKNFMCRYIVERFFSMSSGDSMLERAISVIEKFNYVYFTDDYKATISPIYKALAIQPVELRDNVSEEGEELFAIADEFVNDDIQLYKQAEIMFRGKEDQLHTELSSTWLFRQTPPDLSLLRKYMFQTRLDEFKSWGILNDVITHRKMMVESMQAEIEFLSKGL